MTRPAFLRPKFFLDQVEGTPPKHYDKVARERERRRENGRNPWVGIDGEGMTYGRPLPYDKEYNTVLRGTEHRYVSMSWKTKDGEGSDIDATRLNKECLSTIDCLEFILSIPEKYKIAAYGFTYDLTKILEDLDNNALGLLNRPEKRTYRVKGSGGKSWPQRFPVYWKGYLLDLFNRRFRVGRVLSEKTLPSGVVRYTGKDWRTIHDVIKFYQAPFVTACVSWNIGKPEEHATMRVMKRARSNFQKEYTTEQVVEYSNKECVWLAELATRLDKACVGANVNLGGAYFGAGSIAKALIKKWSKEFEKLNGIPMYPPPLSAEVNHAAMCAFFGGRFDVSLRGKVTAPVHDYDVSSAYPYAIFHLPCLSCGKWTLTKDIERAKRARVAMCRYSLDSWKGAIPPWGPFPFRMPTDRQQSKIRIPSADLGTVPFPIQSDGGWIHKDEFFQGMRMFPNVRFHEAWVYETRCDHRPFENISRIFLERLHLGKEGAGIILKLGMNAVAGNVMQTAGGRPGPYFNPIWAGIITSTTRFQLLEAVETHEKWSDVLMMATDGLWSLREVSMKAPRKTGTNIDVLEKNCPKGCQGVEHPMMVDDLRDRQDDLPKCPTCGTQGRLAGSDEKGVVTRKPLGGWEHGVFEQGVFICRAGVYFPLGLKQIEEGMSDKDVAKVLKDVKARGIGVSTLYKHRDEIVEHYVFHRDMGKQCKPFMLTENPYFIEDDDVIKVIESGQEPFGCDRFIGMKGAILATEVRGKTRYGRRKSYGLWTIQKRLVSFEARPKRDEPLPGLFDTQEPGDALARTTEKLWPRIVPRGQESIPYERMREREDTESDNPGAHDGDQPDWSDD